MRTRTNKAIDNTLKEIEDEIKILNKIEMNGQIKGFERQ